MKISASLLLTLSIPLLANEWPGFLGPRGDNTLPDAEIARSFPESGPKVLWSVDVSEGYGGAAIVGDEVFAMDRVDQEKDVLLCLRLADGKELWRWENKVPGRINHPGSRVVPTVTDDTIYTSSGFGHVYCIDRKTHEARWIVDVSKVFNTDAPRFGFSVHPVLIDGKVIVAPTGGDVGLAALDKTSGDVVWRSAPVGRSHSSPVLRKILGRELLVMPGSENGRLILKGFDPEDGKQVFEYNAQLAGGIHNSIPNISMVGDDIAFFTGGYGQGTGVLKFTESEGKISVTKTGGIAAGATIHPVLQVGDSFFVSAGNGGDRRGRGPRNRERRQGGGPTPAPTTQESPLGGLVCMDATGKVMWSTNSDPALGEGSILNAGGTIISQDGADGSLRLIEPGSAYKELARGKVFTKDTGRELWAPLALSKGLLVMRSQFQIACVDLRPE